MSKPQGIWSEFLLWSPIVVSLAWLVSKASWFWNNNPDMQFGWVIPMLSGYLLFEGFEKRPAVVGRWSVFSVFSIFVGVLFLFLTQIYQAAYGLTAGSMAGLGLGFLGVSMGNLWYAYGSAGVKTFGFGLAFFLIALPIPSVIYGQIISSLQHGITMVNVEVLALLGTPASIQGNLVQLPTGVLGVDEACSGIRSLQSTVMATLFIGYLTLERFGFRTLLFVSGLLLAIIGNLIRVFSLSYSASIHGIEAVDAAHDVAGWSILMFTVVGVGVLSWVFGKMEAAMSRAGSQLVDSEESLQVG